MHMKLTTILAVALASAAGGASAQTYAFPQSNIVPQNNAPRMGWSTSAELGAITTSGNTAGTSVTGKIDARQERVDWSNQYIFTGFFKEDKVSQSDGSTQRQRSAEHFFASARAAYKLLTDNQKLFVLASHDDDKFGAFTRYTTLVVGHSTTWYKSPDTTLDVEVGPGYFRNQTNTGERDGGMTIHGAGNLKWRLSQNATFAQMVSVERSASNTHSAAETSLATKIIDRMQMKAAFSVRNDTSVTANRKNTDTQTSVTLVYSF
jgi:putative salt-induced outer membrane protein YdiY